jgi:hypothetical protein
MNARDMRVSDAERTEVTDRLAQNFADGRLDQAEYDERVARAMSAKTRADFDGLLDDLPGTGAPAGDEPGNQGPGFAGPRYGRRRGGPLRLIFAVVLVMIALSIASHAFWWFFGPWWIIPLIAVIVLAARRR